MGYLGRRIGLSQNSGNSDPNAANGAVGGGILDLIANQYFERQGDIYNAPGAPPSAIAATGGVISEYTSGSDVYRAHVFTASGTFDVSRVSNISGLPNSVEYLVVAGGAGGASGGGGAGGYRTNVPTGVAPPVHNTSTEFVLSAGTYPVTIGGGGSGAPSGGAAGGSGGDSSFGPPSDPARVICKGGGGGGYINADSAQDGGSGGGSGRASTHESPGGATLAITGLPVSPTTQGYAGGTNDNSPSYNGGGGGGAGAAGGNASPGSTNNGVGGVGLRNAIAGPNYPIGTPGPGPTTGGWVAGGGGTGGDGGGSPAASGGAGGGGAGAFPNGTIGTDGTFATGGGAGGGGNSARGGNGGSGLVVLRYKIASISTEKATGGSISFYTDPGTGTEKAIHTFVNSGTFTNTSGSSLPVEYVVVAGGGSGGRYGGGGGAGGYVTATATCPTSAVTISIGGGGSAYFGNAQSGEQGPNGNNTTLTGGLSVTATGGGAGGSYGNPGGTGSPGNAGGSGGGGGTQNDSAGSEVESGGAGANYPGPTQQGYPGGGGWRYISPQGGGGGGGAGQAGSPGPSGSTGGDGLQVPTTFRNPLTYFDSNNQWYLAGGGAGVRDPGAVAGGKGGGGSAPNAGGGNPAPFDCDGMTGTGGGGAATYDNVIGGKWRSGKGGSGIVLIAYPT